MSGGFNPRSHEGNDYTIKQSFNRRCTFQSTFPRGERPKAIRQMTEQIVVSIHVPTRGTTAYASFSISDTDVSIHVPTRGTTRPDVHLCFIHVVSIHVPTRGTTDTVSNAVITVKFQSTFPRGERRLSERLPALYPYCFNPRSHEGNDNGVQLIQQGLILFQSTFPRGERRPLWACRSCCSSVSIHVPTRGTTAITYNFYL